MGETTDEWKAHLPVCCNALMNERGYTVRLTSGSREREGNTKGPMMVAIPRHDYEEGIVRNRSIARRCVETGGVALHNLGSSKRPTYLK